MDKEQLAGALEAVIFVSGDPVPLKRLEEVIGAGEDDIREAIDLLSNRYQETGAGIQVMEVAGGFQLRTRPMFSTQVNAFLERRRKTSLSGPALETLAIIAYKQPITRAEIEIIRGVVVDGVLKSLLDKRLIRVAGVKEVPGRPNLYRTTKRFLEYFGIVSLKDLPPIEDLEKTFSSASMSAEEQPVSDTHKKDDEAPPGTTTTTSTVGKEAGTVPQEESGNTAQDPSNTPE